MSSPAVSHNLVAVLLTAVAATFLSGTAGAGELRVGPTRLDLSAQRPVTVLEVQNTGAAPTLAQLDTFAWTQSDQGDELGPTWDLIATPVVVNLAPGETRVVRVGLREPNRTAVERSYRLFVREVPQAVVPGTGLQFALRISVPVFALPVADSRVAVSGRDGLGWRWVPDIGGCATVQLINPAPRHEHVLAAEMLARNGETLWRAKEAVYVLAAARRALSPSVCAPSIKESVTLRLSLEGHVINLPVEAPSLVVDANVR